MARLPPVRSEYPAQRGETHLANALRQGGRERAARRSAVKIGRL